MKPLTSWLAVAAALALGTGTHAQSPAAASTPASATVANEFTNGEVRKIDREARKITLKHDEIKNLGMPPMAMVLQVSDAAMLEKFKAGDKVRFKAIWKAGKYILTDIQPAN